MAVLVRIPTALRPLTRGNAALNLASAGETLGDLIDRLERDYPGVRDRLLDDTGDFRDGVNVYVDGEDARFLRGVGTRLVDGAEVSIVPAAAGG
ncbi:MAG TPA: MoaD/ThiS family protein [Dehalococcoidia bacterium]|nr:MoaD/ThiS family protein [Dehalococcoidia bacterium]